MRKFSVRPSPVPFFRVHEKPVFSETGLIIGLDPLLQGTGGVFSITLLFVGAVSNECSDKVGLLMIDSYVD